MTASGSLGIGPTIASRTCIQRAAGMGSLCATTAVMMLLFLLYP